MTGTFSIKRRKQDTPRPSGQSSQLSVLQALGIGVGRSSPHGGSKRGHIHLADPRADPALTRARAQQWAAATGRPLPPHLRAREPLRLAEPMGLPRRSASYLVPRRKVPAVLADEMLTDDRLTPAQRRRIVHKAGSHGERPAGWQPDRPPASPRRPRSVAALRRARKNAAQRARHDNRRPAHDPAA